MKTGANIFLTGEPGSGKTHTINWYVSYLRSCGVEPSITASTGIAATHIGGMTIHSWSGIGIKTELTTRDLNNIAGSKPVAKRVAAAKVLIIDEISMLPPYALDMVDAVCRRIRRDPSPFGGLQIVLVGDFFQLPPINKAPAEKAQASLIAAVAQRFAYGAASWQAAEPIVCYLGEQYRQDDAEFLELLSAIRRNKFGEQHLQHLMKRKIDYAKAPAGLPKLFSHNVDVDRVNSEMLDKLPGEKEAFAMSTQGPANLVETLIRGCLSPEILELKLGAAVMFTKNSPKGYYANGTLGTVSGFDGEDKTPVVVTRDGLRIVLEPSDWVLEEGGETLARITQYPLRLAWAITVHKSQGMSLDGAVMDLSTVFEYGQGYVALSRVRRLSGVHLLGYNKRAFEVHPEIVAKDNDFRAMSDDGLADLEAKDETALEQLQLAFIKYCGGTPGQALVKKKAPVKLKIDTHQETLSLWRAGGDLAQIAEGRRLVESTVVAHLEKLAEDGKIKRVEFERLIPPELAGELPVIKQAFADLATTKLSPVFAYFEEKYTFAQLRLVRLLLDNG